jgi:hypothetical protein
MVATGVSSWIRLQFKPALAGDRNGYGTARGSERVTSLMLAGRYRSRFCTEPSLKFGLQP